MGKEIQTLVVGVDQSKYSKLVVKEAQRLAATWGIGLRYIFVRSEIWEPQEYSPELTTLYRKQVQKFYRIKNLDEIDVRYGKPAAEIINFAKTLVRPLIIVGHRGFNPIYQIFLGNTAESIALASPFPVWIHRGTKIIVPEKILIPSDLTEQTDHALEGIETLPGPVHKDIELLHVSKEPVVVAGYPHWSTIYGKMKEVETRRVRAFKKTHPNLQTVETMGSVALSIQKRAKKFDVIALSRKERNEKLPLFGSVTARLIRSGSTPIVVCP